MTGIIAAIDAQPIMIDQQPGYQWPQEGTVVEGTVIDKSTEGTTIEIEGQTIAVPSSVEILEPVGEEAHFQVLHRGKEPHLKYMRPGSGVRSLGDGSSVKPVTVAKDYQRIVDEVVKRMPASGQIEVEAMVRQVQGKLEALVEGFADEDLRQMITDGFNPKKAGVEVVAQVLVHNKPLVRDNRLKAIAVEVGKEVAKLEDQYQDQELLKQIATELKKSGVEVSKKHVDKVLDGLKTVEKIGEMPPRKAVQLLQQLDQTEVEPTIANVYKLLQSPPPKEESLKLPQEELTFMVKTYLQSADLPRDEVTVKAAEELVEKQIPISEPAIHFVKDVQEVLSKTSQETYISKMTDQLAQDKSVKSLIITELKQILDETYVEKKASVEKAGSETIEVKENVASAKAPVTEERLQSLDHLIGKVRGLSVDDMVKAVVSDKHHTLQEVVSVMDEDTGDQVEPKLVSAKVSPTTEVEVTDQSTVKEGSLVSRDIREEAFVFRRQMSEIQLKMTLKAAVMLERQGISVDTEPIESLVNRLETEALASAAIKLKSYGEELQPERNLQQVQQVKEVMDAAVSLKLRHPDTLAHMVKEDLAITMKRTRQVSEALQEADLVETIQKEGGLDHREMPLETKGDINDLVTSSRARVSYDTAMTEVRPDLGDRIEKTFDQIEPLLKDLNLPDTQANVRAVESLARNSMPITEENILEIQVVQEKIDLISDKMTPVTVVKLIQADIQPLDLGLDELMTVVQSLEDEAGDGHQLKVSELIHELDRTGSLKSEERQAMMMIYRTFDTVVRSKGAATGFMVKNELPLTVDGLFEAAKYIRRTRQVKPGVKVDVDDNFGLLEKVSNDQALLGSRKLAGGQRDVTNGNQDVSVQREVTQPSTPVETLRHELMNLRVASFLQNLTPEKSDLLITDQGDKVVQAMPLEELTDLIKNFVTSEEVEVEVKDYLKAISGKPELLKVMVENKIPMTFDNFSKAMSLDRNTFLLMEEITNMIEAIEPQELKAEVIDRLAAVSREVLEGQAPYQALETALEEVEEMIRYAEDISAPEAYKEAGNAKATVNHVQMLQISEDYYQIPVLMDQQVSQLNMYILNQEKAAAKDGSDMKVLMSFDGGSLGKVQSLISLKGNQATMQIQSTYAEDRELLQKYEAAFSQVVEATNFNLIGVSYEAFDAKEPVEAQEQVSQGRKAFDMANGHIDWTV